MQKNNKDNKKTTNGKLFYNVNGCSKRKKAFCIHTCVEMLDFKKVKHISSWQLSQSFSHSNADCKCPGQDSFPKSI